jgi:indolepyruvate decarboxylase
MTERKSGEFPVPSIGRFLLNRLVDAGAAHIFGILGDFNLAFLDQIEAHAELRWVGNANELNAAYMADGYARLNGFAVVVTSYGVGELSAINGIAGAYAQDVPVLRIVGRPSTDARPRVPDVHDGDGGHQHLMRACQEVTCAAASLNEASAVAEVDRVISVVVHSKRPGYLALPTDLVRRPCPETHVNKLLGERARDGPQAKTVADPIAQAAGFADLHAADHR